MTKISMGVKDFEVRISGGALTATKSRMNKLKFLMTLGIFFGAVSNLLP
jgi:hypothetical protein